VLKRLEIAAEFMKFARKSATPEPVNEMPGNPVYLPLKL
jgi:hypothetical protein